MIDMKINHDIKIYDNGNVYEYDPLKDLWSCKCEIAVLKTSMGEFKVVATSGKIYIVGAVVAVDGNIYVIAGLNKSNLNEYYPQTNLKVQLKNTPLHYIDRLIKMF